jgi:hypothetical protein
MSGKDLFAGRPHEEPLDWESLARRFDACVMDPAQGVLFINARGERAFTAFLEAEHDPNAKHELVSFGPIVMGRLLLGQDATDLLPSLAAYFSDKAGIFLNRPGSTRIEMWYLVHELSLAAHITLGALPGDRAAMKRLRRSLETLRTMAHRIDYDFNHQGFDFSSGEPWTDRDIFRQPDVIGGYAYLMLLGSRHFGIAQWQEEAEEALQRYLAFPSNPWYEVPSDAMAVAAAAGLHSLGRRVDVRRALELVLDPSAGLVVGAWGGHEVSGLYRGWRHSTPESAYSLETLVALPLMLPCARHVPELAPLIARYALHTAANARLFFSEFAGGRESRSDLSPDVPYERLLREHEGTAAYAGGDYDGHKSIYGGAYAMWWGALVRRTDVPYVLALDVGSTDFLQSVRKPAWLLYNPCDSAKTVRSPGGEQYEVQESGIRLVP